MLKRALGALHAQVSDSTIAKGSIKVMAQQVALMK